MKLSGVFVWILIWLLFMNIVTVVFFGYVAVVLAMLLIISGFFVVFNSMLPSVNSILLKINDVMLKLSNSVDVCVFAMLVLSVMKSFLVVFADSLSSESVI